jgi:hypothetical protein
MLAQQWILRVLVVIERRCSPVLFAVTGLALGAEHAFVVVIFLVAGLAI